LAARLCLDQHRHDVAFLHDQVLDAIDLDLGARPLAEQHPVAGLDVDRDQLARLVAPAGADGDDLALLRLFLGGIGNDDPSRALFLGVNALDDDTVVKRTELHRHPPKLLSGLRFWRRPDSRKGSPMPSVEYGLQEAVMKNISTQIR